MFMNYGHFSDLLGGGRAAHPTNAPRGMCLMKMYLWLINTVL